MIKTFWDDFVGKEVKLIIEDYITDKYSGKRSEIVRARDGLFIEHDATHVCLLIHKEDRDVKVPFLKSTIKRVEEND